MADMFKIAEIGAKLPAPAFRKLQTKLRLELLHLQQQARAIGVPTLILLSGIRGAGVIDTVNLLNTWMDPRWIATTAFDTPSDEERERPLFWRYWRSLPKAGSIGLYLGGWYSDAVAAKCDGTLSEPAFLKHLQRMNAFEQTLAAEGALILKIWLHLSKSEQKAALPRIDKDPLVGFRASDNTWETPRNYRAYVNAAAMAMRQTADETRPWFIVEGGDDNYRRASVLSALASRLKTHCARHEENSPRELRRKKPAIATSKHNALRSVKMRKAMTDAAYTKAFHKAQIRLHALQQQAREAGVSTVVVFEGWDAAGKGGAIRRLTYALNARDYRVVPIGAPTDEERAHHYLWRFWRQLGRAGGMTVFDRSWYGRVLVERVEAMIDKDTWTRAYAEINDFERQIIEHGSVVVKMWLHITKEEQLKRFKERAETPHKKWKLTPDDWRNREKWSAYEAAVNDMVHHTSSKAAPWHLIAANDKSAARITVLETVADSIESALRRKKAL